jgi:hypothetical protein
MEGGATVIGFLAQTKQNEQEYCLGAPMHRFSGLLAALSVYIHNTAECPLKLLHLLCTWNNSRTDKSVIKVYVMQR